MGIDNKMTKSQDCQKPRKKSQNNILLQEKMENSTENTNLAPVSDKLYYLLWYKFMFYDIKI